MAPTKADGGERTPTTITTTAVVRDIVRISFGASCWHIKRLAAHQNPFESTGLDVQNATHVLHSSNTPAPVLKRQTIFFSGFTSQ